MGIFFRRGALSIYAGSVVVRSAYRGDLGRVPAPSLLNSYAEEEKTGLRGSTALEALGCDASPQGEAFQMVGT